MNQFAISAAKATRNSTRLTLAGLALLLGGSFSLASLFSSKKQSALENQFAQRRKSTYKLPWQNKDIKDWQFKKVKLYGSYKQNRFVIARQRNGKPGYYIFAGFVIGKSKVNPQLCSQNTLVVNLGWIPQSDRSKIEASLQSTEPIEITPEIKRKLTTNITDEEDPFFTPIHEITAYVRSGEEQSFLKKRRNWETDNYFTSIDLDHIANRLYAYDMHAKDAYLEIIGPDGEEELFKRATEQSYLPYKQSSSFQMKKSIGYMLAGVAGAGLSFLI